MKRIVVGMSGGVDSSVAAYLLKKQGYDVLGVFMKNWEDTVENTQYRQGNARGCTWEEDYADMRAVCDQLDIPYTTFNFVAEYRKQVFDVFLKELEKGHTPNPDIACNQEIKFHLFLQKALSIPGVEGIATGHYAAIIDGKLCRPKDLQKDQTYFLYRIDPAVVGKVYFPLAEYTKDEVRRIAEEQNLVTARKKDSTGICFIGDINYGQFIMEYLPKKPGHIITKNGEVIGSHTGLHFYTVGQRKGIDIGGTGPYYVVRKDMEKNVLVVTNDKNDPDLFQTECRVADMHWLQPANLPRNCTVQIRYRQTEQPATLSVHSTDATRILVQFDTPQRAVTPGQSAVFYANNTVLGGGIITE